MTATLLSPRRLGIRINHPLSGLVWVTWRQHRLALAGVVAVLGGLGLFLLFDGLAVHHMYSRLGLASCGALDGPACQSQVTAFLQDYQGWADHLPQLLMFLPGLIGVFVGAPLVARELESGTFRFAWTLARGRVRWIVTKLVLLALVLTALALAFSALFTWWYGPFDAIAGRMSPGSAYEVSGLVFAARTLFGFALGALLGLLVRRTVPAMAATGAAWAATVWPSLTYLRPLIRQPIIAVGTPAKGAVSSGGVPVNADVVNSWIQNAAGHHIGFDQLFGQAIAGNGGAIPSPEKFNAWLAQHQYSLWVSYRPNDWFWHFQTVETAGYAVLAILLAAATVLILRRRVV